MDIERFFSPTLIRARRVWWRVDGELKALVAPSGGAWIYKYHSGELVEKIPWSEGWNEARCGGGHFAPDFRCTCGFWGMKEGHEDFLVRQSKKNWEDLSFHWKAPKKVEMVEGEIEMKGVVIEHARGYRAQFARPLLETIVTVDALP